MQVPDQIKSAVIAQHVPKAIKRFIKMVPADITADYVMLKGAILAFLTRDRAFTPMGLALRDDDAMLVDAIDDDVQQEVNAFVNGKGKGKASGKNKGGKGSSSTATQEGWWMRPCRFCQGRHTDVISRGSKLLDKLRSPELRTLGSKIRSKQQHRSRRAAARAKEETRAAARAKDKEPSPDTATGVAAGVTAVPLAGS